MNLFSKVVASIMTISAAVLSITTALEPKSHISSYSYTPDMNMENFVQAKAYPQPEKYEQKIQYAEPVQQQQPTQYVQPAQDSRRNNDSANANQSMTNEYDPWGDNRGLLSYYMQENNRVTCNNRMDYNQNAMSQYYAQQYNNNVNRSLQQNQMNYPYNNYNNGYCGYPSCGYVGNYAYGYADTTPSYQHNGYNMNQPNSYYNNGVYQNNPNNYNSEQGYYYNNNYPSYQNYPNQQQQYQNQYYGMNGYNTGYTNYQQQIYPLNNCNQNNRQAYNSFLNEIFDYGNQPAYVDKYYGSYPNNNNNNQNVQQYQPNTMNNSNTSSININQNDVCKYASFNVDEVPSNFMQSMENTSKQTCAEVVGRDCPKAPVDDQGRVILTEEYMNSLKSYNSNNAANEVNTNNEKSMEDMRSILSMI